MTLAPRRIIFLLVTFELIIIVIILANINTRNKLLGESVIVVPIEKKRLQFTADNAKLKYFNEPKADSIQTDERDWLSYSAIYTINFDSLNERFNYSFNKPDKTFRIITLGDSFTFGHFVNTSENFPERLEDRLNEHISCPGINRFEVINLGVPGYDLEHAVERYRKRGQKYQPDFLIWFIKNDDLVEINEIMMQKKDLYEQEMKSTGELETHIKNGDHFPFWKKAISETYRQMGSDKILEYNLSAATRLTNYYQSKLLIITPTSLNKEHSHFIQILTNIRPGIYHEQIPADFPTLPDSHPSKDGHNQISKDILNIMFEKYLPGCSQH